VGNFSGSVRIVDAARGVVLAEYQHAGANHQSITVRKVTWSPDGARLVSTGEDRRIYLSDVDAEGRLLGPPVSIGDTGPWAKFGAAFSPDGTRLLTTRQPPPGSKPGPPGAACLAIRAVPDGSVIHVLEHDSTVSRAAWDPSGARVVAGTMNGTLSLWDAATGALVSKRPSPGLGPVVHLEWSPSSTGAALAIAYDQGAVVYRDGGLDPSSVFECLGHEASTQRIAWGPRGDWVVTASRDCTARIWDVATGTLRMVLRADAAVVGAAFYPIPRSISSPRGRRAAPPRSGMGEAESASRCSRGSRDRCALPSSAPARRCSRREARMGRRASGSRAGGLPGSNLSAGAIAAAASP